MKTYKDLNETTTADQKKLDDNLWKATEKVIRIDAKMYPKWTFDAMVKRYKRQVTSMKISKELKMDFFEKIEDVVNELRPKGYSYKNKK